MSETNLYWTGYYLTPAPSQGHPLGWMGTRPRLADMGWGFAPVYVGQQDPAAGTGNSTILTSAQGGIDAENAVALASGEGFGTGSAVFLDVEIGGPVSQANLDYIGAWLEGVFSAGYTGGVYGNAASRVTDQVRALDSRALLWGIGLGRYSAPAATTPPYPEPDPAGCGFADASLWQLLQGSVLRDANGTALKDDFGAPLTIDLDSALSRDPSSLTTPPSATVPEVASVSPDSGGQAGGEQITVRGSGFTNATAVGFGDTGSPDFVVASDEELTAVAPPGTGNVEISVFGPGGVSAPNSPSDEYAYLS
ncbi:glycoside hydrolase domain-containing protein [Amycolatopsis sp. NPDC021455]|uniref:glycoside hydrolase domain-containing protein n=1 Tax=Amycolatopsis sp. NPDC021455 TaxID=3154901 RepID=UPI0033E0DCA6